MLSQSQSSGLPRSRLAPHHPGTQPGLLRGCPGSPGELAEFWVLHSELEHRVPFPWPLAPPTPKPLQVLLSPRSCSALPSPSVLGWGWSGRRLEGATLPANKPLALIGLGEADTLST